jgi:hypothetical protein
MNLPFKNSILSWVMKKRIHQIDLFRRHPVQMQDEVFRSLVEKGRYSQFGEEHGFKSIYNYLDFCKNIPIRTYEELFPYIEKIRIGEKDVLWPGEVKWFAKSSGTTNNKSKYIPISIDSLEDCHFKGGKDMLSLYCNSFPNTNVYNGKGLMLGGSQEKDSLHSFTDGDLSAILINNFPFWVNMHRVPDLKTALLKDWETKLELISNQALEEDVTNITGVPSWVLVLMNKMLEKSGSNNILEIWPNLELYMHGGVNFSPYKSQFEKLIPTDNMNYLEAYNASEGFFAIQDQKDKKDLLLMLDYGIFYEFIPISNYNNGERIAIPLSEVKIDEVYVIVISTNTGLWRYIVGDTIRFTSLSPYRIKIVGRTKSFLNAVGEELVIENAELGIDLCCKKYNCSVSDFIATAIFIEKGVAYHKWIIEFNIPPISILNFQTDLDEILRGLNSDYDAKRTGSFVLLPLEVYVATKYLFYNWLKNSDRLGGQYKVPRLDDSSSIFNEILLLHTTY